MNGPYLNPDNKFRVFTFKVPNGGSGLAPQGITRKRLYLLTLVALLGSALALCIGFLTAKALR